MKDDQIREGHIVIKDNRISEIGPQVDLNAKYDKVRNSNPLKRFVTTEEVAETAAYITECTYLNAQTIVLDGGMIS